jgi:uncharacterized protein (TIGR03790 family)
MIVRIILGALFAMLVFLATPRAAAQSSENLLLVVNQASPDSERIAAAYARVRSISDTNILRLQTDISDEISRVEYARRIEAPIAAWIGRQRVHDRLLYIVLTKGIPLRIAGSAGRQGTRASVDSELAMLYRKLTGRAVAPSGPVPNPYFLGERPLSEARRFTHENYDVYLVTRLDGFTVEDVLALIDRGVNPVRDGSIVLDRRSDWFSPGGNEWLDRAAARLRERGEQNRVVVDPPPTNSDRPLTLGYYSWGSNDPTLRDRRLPLKFAPGALAAMFVSSDARTFQEPPQNWTVGASNDSKSVFAGSAQSLAGDLIRDGATGVAGHVAEPYLDGTIRPDILFPAYLAGLSLAEAFYLAMPYLSWQTVVVGDPLCAPFQERPLLVTEIDQGLDLETELPSLFSARWLNMLSVRGAKPAAVKLLLRGQGRLARDDTAGAQQALEAATALDAELQAAHRLLASLYLESGQYDRAIERYQLLLQKSRADAVALNNLAYALAVHRASPREALPIAEKAYGLAKGDPLVADTLGWIHHLLGDHRRALSLLQAAAKAAPGHAEIRLHLAFVYAALGLLGDANQELGRAVELDPKVENRPEVTALRASLKAGA